MNKSKFFNIVFVLTGSFVLIVLSIVAVMNFMKDARIFQQTVATAVQDPETKPAAEKSDKEQPLKKIIVNTGDKNTDGSQSKQQDTQTAKTDKKNNSADPQKPTDTGADPKKEKIIVEVINYSGIKRVAEEIKTTLEASGYEVSAGNEKSNKPLKSQILERNDKKAGSNIQKLLKIGPIVKAPDPTSRFDVTVIIGDDYKP